MTRPMVNGQRLLDDLSALSGIGSNADGGVSRPAMSPADVLGRAWFEERTTQSGLEFRKDGAGNLSALLRADAATQTLLLGSHLDTVPNGGRFDGALGVLSALEVLRTVREAGLHLPFNLEAISFTDEEGYILPLLGSRAVAGLLSESDLLQPRGGMMALQAGLARLGITPETILAAKRSDILAYLEIHIEQGIRLERANINLGIVTSIVGIRSMWLRFSGQAAHAGTTPMTDRADALWGVSAFVHAARELVMSTFASAVMNIGQMIIEPGVFNIVPAEVRLALEFRHASLDGLDSMEAALLDMAHQVTQQYGLRLAVDRVGNEDPVVMSPPLMRIIEAVADDMTFSHMRLASFAGHDAMSISKIAPTSMIFAPSVNGISHNPHELTNPTDVINAANLMLGTVLRLNSAGLNGIEQVET